MCVPRKNRTEKKQERYDTMKDLNKKTTTMSLDDSKSAIISSAQTLAQKMMDSPDDAEVNAMIKSILPSANLVPSIEEQGPNGQITRYDPYSRLLKDRTILLEGEVNDGMASIACACLLYLSKTTDKDITVQINSPGGSVIAGLAIYDIMRMIKNPITTQGLGMQASMGSIFLASGDTRMMSDHSKLMIHQISGGSKGQATDMALSYAFSEQLHEDLKSVYVRHIGLTHAFWDLALERDTWLTSKQALKMGFIHKIADKFKPSEFDNESIRSEFESAKALKIPKTADGIIAMLNNASSKQGESAALRGDLVTALSQFPQFWTEGKIKKVYADNPVKVAELLLERKVQNVAKAEATLADFTLAVTEATKVVAHAKTQVADATQKLTEVKAQSLTSNDNGKDSVSVKKLG
jgi:ATP-dependent Clp protease protease subunit